MKKKVALNALVLKILAAIFMTIDHIGVFLVEPFYGIESPFYLALRIIGRLSFPLFAFLIVESIFHTRSRFKFLLRLFISTIVFGLAGYLIPKIFNEYVGLFNIFWDLFLGASIICLLEKKKFQKLWAIIPIAIYVLLVCFDSQIPTFLRLEYHYYGVLIILGFYFARLVSKKYYQLSASKLDLTVTQMEEIMSYQKVSNIFAITFLVIINLSCWGITKIFPQLDIINVSLQVIAMFSGIFILFYNGEKGFSSKYLKYSFYLYYPGHLGILYLIYLLL